MPPDPEVFVPQLYAPNPDTNIHNPVSAASILRNQLWDAEPEYSFNNTISSFAVTPAQPEIQVQPESQVQPENTASPKIQAREARTKRTSQTPSKWYCEPCKRPFNNGKHYGQHKKNVHREKAFFCDFCATTFVRPD